MAWITRYVNVDKNGASINHQVFYGATRSMLVRSQSWNCRGHVDLYASGSIGKFNIENVVNDYRSSAVLIEKTQTPSIYGENQPTFTSQPEFVSSTGSSDHSRERD